MSSNTRDWEPEVTNTPPLADKNDVDNEIAVDVPEQNGMPELDQREEEVETREEPGARSKTISQQDSSRIS